MTFASSKFEGSFAKLANNSQDKQGSIHDDSAARSLGFKGGFVPGSTVAARALTACDAIFGQAFFDKGSYDLNFVSPVYVDEEVRATAESSDGRAMITVESAEGRICCNGIASPVPSNPWSDAPDVTAPDVFVELTLGDEFDPMPFVVGDDDVVALLRSAGVDPSPFQVKEDGSNGRLHPEYLHVLALRQTRQRRLGPFTGVQQPGMWASHALVTKAPLYLGTEYVMKEHLADKGRSGRTLFVTYEFSVEDSSGSEIARGRHRIKWLAANEE